MDSEVGWVLEKRRACGQRALDEPSRPFRPSSRPPPDPRESSRPPQGPSEMPPSPRMWCKQRGRTPRMMTTPTMAMMKRRMVGVTSSFNRRPRRGARIFSIATPPRSPRRFSHVAHAFPTSPPLPTRRQCPQMSANIMAAHRQCDASTAGDRLAHFFSAHLPTPLPPTPPSPPPSVVRSNAHSRLRHSTAWQRPLSTWRPRRASLRTLRRRVVHMVETT